MWYVLSTQLCPSFNYSLLKNFENCQFLKWVGKKNTQLVLIALRATCPDAEIILLTDLLIKYLFHQNTRKLTKVTIISIISKFCPRMSKEKRDFFILEEIKKMYEPSITFVMYSIAIDSNCLVT